MTQFSNILEYDDNTAVVSLYGAFDVHLKQIAQHYDVSISSRGNTLILRGNNNADIQMASDVLNTLYEQIKRGRIIDTVYVAQMLQTQISDDKNNIKNSVDNSDLIIHTRSKTIYPKSQNQKNYVQLIRSYDVVFGTGAAGTGKTYLAVAMGVEALLQHKVKRIILSRPAVEAGERLGFLPGDLRNKIDPYLQPLYDSLHDMLPTDQINRFMEMGVIEIAPLAFMRGRTLSDSFIILDEAQNTTISQMKMFLTRLGQNSKMVITGDLSQIDLTLPKDSGLQHVKHILKDIEAIKFVTFNRSDILRHPIVSAILEAYDNNLGG